MSTRVGRDNARRTWAASQRAMGAADARAGRPRAMSDPDYQQGYDRGSAPCQCSNLTAHPAGCPGTPAETHFGMNVVYMRMCLRCLNGHNEEED